MACYPIPCGLSLRHGRDTGGIKSGKGGMEMKWIKYTHAWNSIKNKNNQKMIERKEILPYLICAIGIIVRSNIIRYWHTSNKKTMDPVPKLNRHIIRNENWQIS